MTSQLRVLAMELGATDVGKLVIQRLRDLIPDIWIAGVEKRADYEQSEFDLVITNQHDAFFGRYESVNMPSLAMTPELSILMAPYEAKLLNAAGLAGIRDPHDYPQSIHGVPAYSDSYDSRKDLLYRHIRFWDHVLTKHQIQAVFHENLGQEVFDYVALQIARARGLPTLTFNISGQFPLALFVQESEHELGALRLGYELKQRIRDRLVPERPDFITSAVTKFTSTPNSGLAARQDSYVTAPLRSWLVNRSIHADGRGIRSIVKSVGGKLIRFAKAPRSRYKRFSRTRGLVRDTQRSFREEAKYSRGGVVPDPYIYFPLHFQPETSSSVKGRHFYVLREAVAFVASELPDGWKLVVKEHPHQFRRLLRRPEGFYSQLAAIPNVYLAHHTANNNELVQRAKAVVSVSHSSITSYALFRGKPVISLGDSHFREASGYHCISSTDGLRQVMTAIAAGWDETRTPLDSDFLHRLSQSTFEGEFGEKPDSLTTNEWNRLRDVTGMNIGSAIAEWLKLKQLA